jgi:peptide/nickel transport system ATP-binding protein
MEIQKEHQFGTMFTSHDLAVVDLFIDRISVMVLGEIVEQGSKKRVLRSPQVDHTKRLISEVPIPDPRERDARIASMIFLDSLGLSHGEGWFQV